MKIVQQRASNGLAVGMWFGIEEETQFKKNEEKSEHRYGAAHQELFQGKMDYQNKRNFYPKFLLFS